jgi:osmotically-inducible protein OsmY
MSSAILELPTAATALLSASNPELRRLEVRETDEEVQVSGQVSSFYLKQLAQEAVRPAAKGRPIVNRVEVRR